VDPIRTFSVGIGPFENDELSYEPPFMGRLAIAGGTRASETCDPNSTDVAKACHFQITPNGRPLDEITQDFIDAMIAIRGRLRSSCDMDIVGNVSAVDFSKTTARWVDRLGASHPIPKSATNGWSYDSATAPRKVLIHGPTCTTILADPLSEIDVSLVCP